MGVRYCPDCDIEMAYEQNRCWLCGGLLKFRPHSVETDAWRSAAYSYREGDAVIDERST